MSDEPIPDGASAADVAYWAGRRHAALLQELTVANELIAEQNEMLATFRRENDELNTRLHTLLQPVVKAEPQGDQ